MEQPVTRNLRLRAGFPAECIERAGDSRFDRARPSHANGGDASLRHGNGTIPAVRHHRASSAPARQRELFFSLRPQPCDRRPKRFRRIHRQLPERRSFIPTRSRPNPPTFRIDSSPGDRSDSRAVFGLAPVFEYRNGFPYSVVNEQQRYVGIPNSNRFPNFLSADARVWRDFKVNLQILGAVVGERLQPDESLQSGSNPLEHGRSGLWPVFR